MKYFNYLLISLFLIVFFSCANEEELSSEKNKNEVIKKIEVVDLKTLTDSNYGIRGENSILKFKDENTLKETISILEKMTKEEREIWSNQFDNFKSIEQIYKQAMVKADSLDFTEQEYKQFKEKYSEHLYFPEYKDDFGAYIPFVNTYLSYITNKDCKYMVGNQTIQVEMIKNYEQLQQSGQALYNSIEDMQRLKRSSETVNRLEEVRCNNRKLWVKCRLKPSNHPGIGYDILVEVSFRKKGAFGAWYNYSSKSELGWDGGMSWEKSGYSSHDYLWAKTGQPFKGRMWVKFRGFGSKCGDTKYFFNVNL